MPSNEPPRCTGRFAVKLRLMMGARHTTIQHHGSQLTQARDDGINATLPLNRSWSVSSHHPLSPAQACAAVSVAYPYLPQLAGHLLLWEARQVVTTWDQRLSVDDRQPCPRGFTSSRASTHVCISHTCKNQNPPITSPVRCDLCGGDQIRRDGPGHRTFRPPSLSCTSSASTSPHLPLLRRRRAPPGPITAGNIHRHRRVRLRWEGDTACFYHPLYARGLCGSQQQQQHALKQTIHLLHALCSCSIHSISNLRAKRADLSTRLERHC